jgi:hypothetical protein
LVQRPRALDSPHDTQVPTHALLQQAPSTQNPDWQSPGVLQTWPLAFLPQLPAVQTLGDTQSSLTEHDTRQALPAHWNGAHGIAAPAWHKPSPSQVAEGSSLPLVHEAARHSVPAANFAQPPAPLHRPLEPQLLGMSALHCPCGSGFPAATGEHSPTNPIWLQLTHGPVQARLQQTPSAQFWDAQSVPAVHIAPSGFFPHDPPVHARASHWPLPVQDVKQRPDEESQP